MFDSAAKCELNVKIHGPKKKDLPHRPGVTYLFLPRIGDSPIITEARAVFTCWLGSATNSFTYERMLFMIIFSRWLGSRFWQKSLTLFAAAARTSASESFSKDWNAPTKSALVISGPTAVCNFTRMYKTSLVIKSGSWRCDWFLNTHLGELVCNHVPHSPRCVINTLPQSRH